MPALDYTGAINVDIQTAGPIETEIDFTGPEGPQGPAGPPGLTGPPGPSGPTGDAGQGVVSITTLPFEVPPVDGITQVVVNMTPTYWLQVGMEVYVQGAGYFTVSALTSGTVSLLNTGAQGNALSGTTVPVGNQVSISGSIGPTGPQGPQGVIGASGPQGIPGPIGPPGVAYSSVTTAAAVTPGKSPATVTISVNSSAGLIPGTVLYFNTLSWIGYYVVTAVPDGTHVTITDSGTPGNPIAGTTVPITTSVIGSGPQGPTGVAGPVGAAGPVGPIGQGCFTTTTAQFVAPPVNVNGTLKVVATNWVQAGQYVFLNGLGYYLVQQVNDANTLTILNTGVPENHAAGTILSAGGLVTSSGAAGITGAQGPTGISALSKTTAPFSSPSAGQTITVPFDNTGWLVPYCNVFIAGSGSYQVQAIQTGNQVILTCISPVVPAGTNVAQGSLVSATGAQGPTGVQGPAGTPGTNGAMGPPGPAGTTVATTTAANYTQPAVNSTVGITLAGVGGVSPGLVLYINGGGYYTVVSVAGSVATCQNLGYPINVAPGTVVNSGANVGASGPIGPTGVAGPAGSVGPTGPAGTNAVTLTSAGFTVPPVGSTVVVTVSDASWVVPGQMVWIDQAGGGVGHSGSLQVVSKAGNQLTLLTPPQAPAIPLATTTAPGLMAPLSGRTTDFIDGTDTAQNLAGAVSALTLGRYYGTDTANSGAYIVSVASDFLLTPGVVVWVLPTNANSAASPTLNVNGTGVKAIVNRSNIALSASELAAGKMFGVVYDGTSWRLVTPITRIYRGTNPGTVTIECAGYDAVSVWIQMNASGQSINVTFAHLAEGTPVSIDLVNLYSAALTYLLQCAGGAVWWILANTVAGSVATQLSSAAQSLTNGNNFMANGTVINGSLYLK